MRFVLSALLAAGLAGPASAAAVAGRVEMTDKNGKLVSDLSEAVVYVEGAKARATPQKVSITMKGKEFRPHIVIVPVGSTVAFPNEDPIFHNVFSVSGDNRFDLDLYKRPKVGERVFEQPGIVRVYCNIHPQMSAIVVIRDNPWYAKAGRDGAFSIEGVPPGKYTLTAWHERAQKPTTIELTVTDKGVADALLALDGRGFKRQQHKNKFGKDYAEGEKY